MGPAPSSSAALPLTGRDAALPRLAGDLPAHDQTPERCAALLAPPRLLPGAVHDGAATGKPPERPWAAPLPAPGRHAGAGQRLRVRHVSRAVGRVHSRCPPGPVG